MLEIENNKLFFKNKIIWFSDIPYDVNNCSAVNFLECRNNVGIEGFSKKEFTTLIINLTSDLDTIWKNMSKSSCRYSINKAIKDEVDIKLNQNYEEFLNINRQFRKNKGIGKYSLNTNFMQKYGTLFIAKHRGECIGGQLYIEDKDTIRWLIGASKRLNVSKEEATLIGNANRLMIWEAIKYAKNRNIKEFDFGGYYTGIQPDRQKEDINKFKKSFGGELVTRYNYQKDYSKTYSFIKYMYQFIK